MELPAAKQEEILQDLIKFINQRGGAVGCERLQDFFVRHPGHRLLLKSMGGVASFCEKHPARISVGPGDGPHLRLSVQTAHIQAVEFSHALLYSDYDYHDRSQQSYYTCLCLARALILPRAFF